MDTQCGAPSAEPAAVRQGFSSELQALLDATVDAVILIDGRGCIQVFNRSAERLFGYGEQELIGANVSVLMTDADRHSHDGYLARYLKTRVPHIIGIGRDLRARRKDGSTFPAFLSVGEIGGTEPPRFVGFLHDMTTREQAMLAVQRERDRANQYLDIVQTALVVLDAGRRVSLVNRKGCEILGRSEDELIGCDWLESAVPAGDRATARAQLAQLLERGERTHYCEYHVQTPGGSRRLIAWHCVAIRDAHGDFAGVICSGDDITERRRTEQTMDRTRALLQEAQGIAHIGNFELYHPDSDGDYWSPEAYRIFGLDPDRGRLTRERSAAFVHPDDRARFDDAWREALRSTGTFELDFRLMPAGGGVRSVQARYQVFDLGNARRRIAGTLHDITDRQRAAEEARRSEARMTHVSRLATMGEMAAGIAHELNQPLAAIATYAQASQRLLEPGVADIDEVRGALRQIASQALRAGEVIRRLRSLVQDRATRREPSDANEVIGEVATLTETDARLHDVRIRFELAAGLPRVEIDRVQIQQVLLNLFRNAIEALESGGAAAREIAVRTRLDADGELELSVCDNGPGVAPHILDTMFDPFCTSKAEGTGLGLAISRSIVEAHHGRLGHRPNEPRGACFYVRLPTMAGAES